MLNMGLQTYFEVFEFRIRVAVAPFGVNMNSSILTRRGGTDANTSQRLRAAIPRDWRVGILGPMFLDVWKIFPKIIPQNTNIDFCRTWLAEMSDGTRPAPKARLTRSGEATSARPIIGLPHVRRLNTLSARGALALGLVGES